MATLDISRATKAMAKLYKGNTNKYMQISSYLPKTFITYLAIMYSNVVMW